MGLKKYGDKGLLFIQRNIVPVGCDTCFEVKSHQLHEGKVGALISYLMIIDGCYRS